MTYLLDTNTCIYIIKRRPQATVDKMRAKRPEQIAISTVTIAELEYGVAKSQRPEQNQLALMQFLVPFEILDFDHRAAQDYGHIRARLESEGSPIGSMDLLLAAQAMSLRLILVTNNEKEFGRVEGLRIENWAVGG